jgi:hypothetical protein
VGTQKDGSFWINTGLVAGEEYDLLTTESSQGQSVDSSEIPPRAAIRAIAAEEDHCPSVTLRQRARARLEVKAINLTTRAPISPVDAHFRFTGETSWRGATDDKGELLVPPGSRLEVQVGAVGFEDSEVLTILTPETGKEADLPVALKPAPTGCITGTIVDQNGSPVPAARIQAGPSRKGFESGEVTYSNADGEFKFQDMRPGEYLLFIYAAEYPNPVVQPQNNVGPLNVPSGTGCADASKKLGPRAAKLQLHVIDATTQERIKEAPVHLNGKDDNGGVWSLNAWSDDGNGAAFTLVPAFTAFTVQAGVKGYAKSQILTMSPLQPEQVQEITIVLQRDPRR